MITEPTFYTTDELAEMFDVLPQVPVAWRFLGIGPEYYCFGCDVRYSFDDVLRWLMSKASREVEWGPRLRAHWS